MGRTHLPFIDWLKSAGMALIVFGHVSSAADALVPPIYPKQLGVASFVFLTGHSLARESRGGARVVFDRLFEVYLFGLATALVLGLVKLARVGDPNESNFLPFLAGANVLLDGFPANPTTWYIGCYIQIVIIWAVCLRGRGVTPRTVALVGVAEVAARAALLGAGRPFAAYMNVLNWATVFGLGLLAGRRAAEKQPRGLARPLLGLGLLVAAWPLVVRPFVAEPGFPMMRLGVGPALIGLAATSLAVTLAYASFTWAAFRLAVRLAPSALAAFLARNTLIVFLTHMPIYYMIHDPMTRRVANGTIRVALEFLVCFPLLAVASELVRRVTRPGALRRGARDRLRAAARRSSGVFGGGRPRRVGAITAAGGPHSGPRER